MNGQPFNLLQDLSLEFIEANLDFLAGYKPMDNNEESGEASTGDKSNAPGSGAAGGGRGSLAPSNIIVKPYNFGSSSSHKFTQRFQFILKNQNWTYDSTSPGTTPGSRGTRTTQMPYYTIPLEHLWMYINPGEYMWLKKMHRQVRGVKASANFRYMSFRPTYTTGGVEVLIASTNAVGQIGIWEGFKNIFPYRRYFKTTTTSVGLDLDGATPTQMYDEFVKPLYGLPWSTGNVINTPPAIDGPVQWNVQPTVINYTYFDVRFPGSGHPNFYPIDYVSGLNLLKNRTACFNTNGIDTTFGWKHDIKNGLMFQATTAFCETVADEFQLQSISVPYLSRNPANFADPTDSVNANITNDPEAKTVEPFIPSELGYLRGNIENYSVHNFNEPFSADTPREIIWGVDPILNTDGKIVEGTTMWEIETEFTVAFDNSFPLPMTYLNGGAHHDFEGLKQLNGYTTCDTAGPLQSINVAPKDSFSYGGRKNFRVNENIAPNVQVANNSFKKIKL